MIVSIARNSVFVCCAVALLPADASAQLAAVVAAPVDHPVSIHRDSLTPYLWRNKTGGWGETLVDEMYRLRGFDEVFELKTPGGQGIDRLALKYDATGHLVDLRFAEAKTHFGGKAKLSVTKRGRQLSKEWLIEKFRAMQDSGDPRLRQLIHDIHRFRRERGLSMDSFVERFGEFHDVNTRSGRYVRRGPITGVELSDDSIEDAVNRVARYAKTRTGRAWGARSRSQLNLIQNTSITMAIGRHLSGQHAAQRGFLRRGLARTKRATVSGTLRRLTRAAGPLGAAVAVAMDAQEIYSHIAAYRRGEINRREFIIVLSQSGGGILGAGAGAATGAWIGSFGGPAAWITVPAGASVGGVAGYFGGSTTSGAMARAWYSGVDEKVKSDVDAWIIRTSYLQLNAGR